jgi:hypothetical protein
MGRQGRHEHTVHYAFSIFLSLLLLPLSVWCSATIAQRCLFIFDDIPPFPLLILLPLPPVYRHYFLQRCISRPRFGFGFRLSLGPDSSAVGVAVVVAERSWRARNFAAM